MNSNEGKEGQGKDSKLSNLQKAVKCNWNKANWKVKNCEKYLEAKLSEYHEERQKIMKLFDLKKSQLVKKYVNTTVARPQLIEKDDKEGEIGKDAGSSKTQAGTPSSSIDGKKTDRSGNEEAEPRMASNDRRTCLREQSKSITRKISGSGRPLYLPEMGALVRQVAELDTKTESIEIAGTRAAQRFSAADNVQRRKLSSSRKASSWEIIGRAENQTPFFPEIGNRVQRISLTLNRSRSYTLGENSDAFFPARERKMGVYQLQSVPTMDYGHRNKPDSRQNSARVSSLEEQFEKLQSCRYLRSSDVLK